MSVHDSRERYVNSVRALAPPFFFPSSVSPLPFFPRSCLHVDICAGVSRERKQLIFRPCFSIPATEGIT